jgi:two-component system, NtrC family, response regulator AtoC
LAENTIEIIRLLAVSREPVVLRLLGSLRTSNSWQVETAATGWDAMERVQSAMAPHILLLDLPEGDGDSLQILRWLRKLRPDLPVIVFACPEDSVGEREAARLGAEGIRAGSLDERQLELMIRHYIESAGAGRADIACERIERFDEGAFFLSASPVMQKLRAQAELLAQADVPILLLGEEGSGKETVAKLIHRLSVRSGFKLRKVNCATTPPDLLEAELFVNDHSRSSDDHWSSPGKFEAGEKGTIFLDEIAEMPDGMQFRLLQALQHNEFSRPCRNGAVPADVRILAASSASIDRALAEKTLREDLYYRLSAFTIEVPPLRQRKGDIGILLRYSMHQLARHYGLPSREFSSLVLDACQQYSWPGNLRELESFVKRYLLAGDDDLAVRELGLDSSAVSMGQGPSRTVRQTGALPEPRVDSKNQVESESLKTLIDGIKSEAEKKAIGSALQKTRWNRKAAARLLGISYRTLLYKIEQYGMRVSDLLLSPLPQDELSAPTREVKVRGKAS